MLESGYLSDSSKDIITSGNNDPARKSGWFQSRVLVCISMSQQKKKMFRYWWRITRQDTIQVEILVSRKFGVLMQNEFWRNFNLADCSLQHMKLFSFIILVAGSCFFKREHAASITVYAEILAIQIHNAKFKCRL